MSRRYNRYPRIGRTHGCLAVLVIVLAVGFGVVRLIRPFLRHRTERPPAEENHRRSRHTVADESPVTVAAAADIYLKLGNPSGAVTDTKSPTNYLLVNQAYALSYDRDRGTANWVSWRLTASDLGDVHRDDEFRPDDRLPEGWPRVLPTDYSRSGYSRGHLCPAGDRTSTPEASSATFLMTNMVPQTNDSNEGVWETLEVYCRTLVRQGATLYIIAGAYGDGGRLHDRVTIPTNLWKVVVVVPEGEALDDGLSPNTRVIAINTPNIPGVRYEDWRKYTTTVRAIEQVTGYDLLSKLPRDQQERVENSVAAF